MFKYSIPNKNINTYTYIHIIRTYFKESLEKYLT